MAYDVLRSRRFEIEQDTSTEDEQPRWFECFQCVAVLMNIAKMSRDEPRWICRILDLENKKIAMENEQIINPVLRNPLKRCPYHPDVEPEEPLIEE